MSQNALLQLTSALLSEKRFTSIVLICISLIGRNCDLEQDLTVFGLQFSDDFIY